MSYANRHIPSFLDLPLSLFDKVGSSNDASSVVQVVDNGSLLTADNFRSEKLSLQKPVLVRDSPESIGMKLPRKNKSRGKAKQGHQALTVRDIADIVGHATPVIAIDVEFQEELEGWRFADLVEYFEDQDRVGAFVGGKLSSEASAATSSSSSVNPSCTNESSSHRSRPQRQAAKQNQHRQQLQRHRVINQISYEFSRTPLGKQVRSPVFVRELDWIDKVWPKRRLQDDTMDEEYPRVQYYCLTSAAGCYTDFHVDFGGSSVWYHVLSGAKEFCLIQPTPENLQIYEEWLCSSEQAQTFLPDRIENKNQILRIELKQNQTMIIPAGWIHSVFTPTDSLVFGGNFLHGLDMDMQLQIYSIEVRSKVLDRFRFPFFLPLQYYAGAAYLQRLHKGIVCQQEVRELGPLIDALTVWWSMHSQQDEARGGVTIARAAEYGAKQNGCATFDEVLVALKLEHDRVVRNGVCPAAMTKESNAKLDVEETNILPSPSASTSLPKIRLKLGSPVKKNGDSEFPAANEGNNEVRLKLGSAVARKSQDTDSSVPEIGVRNDQGAAFRITLSTSAQTVDPLPVDVPVSRSKHAERMDDLFDERDLLKDDAWEPPPSVRSSVNRQFRSPGTGGYQNKRRSPNKNGPVLDGVAKKAKQATTSRQRLLKKVR